MVISKWRFIAKSFLLFLYVFNLKFIGLEFASTIRLAFLVLFLMYGIRSLRLLRFEIKANPLIFAALGMTFFWALFSSVFGYSAGVGVFSPVSVMIVFSLYGAMLICFLFSDIEEFLKSVLLIVFVQSVFVYISFFSSEFRVFTASILVETGNIPLTSGSRVAGFSNSSGSTLSFTLSLGVFAAMCLMSQGPSLFKRLLYAVLGTLITISCIFVGKLGLLYSLIFLLLGFIFSLRTKQGIFHMGVVSIVVIFVSVGSIAMFVLSSDNLGHFVYALFRSFSIFLTGQDSTAVALLEMPIPKLDVYSFVGHGGVSAFGESNATHSDVGYVRSFYALGLVFSTLLYGSLFLFMMVHLFRVKSSPYFIFYLLLLLLVFVAELKEPFIFKVNFVLFLTVSLYLLESKNLTRAYFQAHKRVGMAA